MNGLTRLTLIFLLKALPKGYNWKKGHCESRRIADRNSEKGPWARQFPCCLFNTLRRKDSLFQPPNNLKWHIIIYYTITLFLHQMNSVKEGKRCNHTAEPKWRRLPSVVMLDIKNLHRFVFFTYRSLVESSCRTILLPWTDPIGPFKGSDIDR